MRGEGKEVVKLLLSKGANVNDKDNDGRSPLDIASLNGHAEIENILKKWSHTMGVISLENLHVYNAIGDYDNLKDLQHYIGTNNAGGGRNKKSKRFRKKKSKNNKKKRKTIRKRR